MKSFLKITLLFLLMSFGFFQNTFAQKQKILVVPYTRFQFISEYKLSEIASSNSVTESEIYNLYVQGLSSAFLNYKSEQFEFEMIGELDYLSLKKYIKYDIEKFKGRKYNSSNLNLVSTDQFSELLDQNKAQYIVFVNWYAIEKNVHTTYTGDNNKRNAFSLHKLDYDVYNNKKEKIIGKGNAKLNCGDFPSSDMIKEKCLNPNSLSACYQELITDLLKEISSIK